MVQSPSWAANWFAASQEIPLISLNPKVHYSIHKRTPPVSILGQPNPVHIPTSHLLEIHPNIIHPSTPRSPQWSLSLYTPLSSPIRATCPDHLILLDFITRTILGKEYKSFSSSLCSSKLNFNIKIGVHYTADQLKGSGEHKKKVFSVAPCEPYCKIKSSSGYRAHELNTRSYLNFEIWWCVEGKLVVATHRCRSIKLTHLQLCKTWCIILACDEEIQITGRGYAASDIIMQWILNIKRCS